MNTASAPRTILIVSGVILAISALSLFNSLAQAKKASDLSELNTQIKLLGEEMARLRGQVEAYEKAKTLGSPEAASTAAAAAATPASK